MNRRLMQVFCALLLAVPLSAQTAEELVRSTSFFGSAENVFMKITMTLSSKSGSKERGIEVSMKRNAGSTLVLACMVSPAFLSQMKFLTHRQADGRVDTWLKTSQGVRKLAASGGTEKVFDSDFTVEDFTGLDPAGFSCVLLPDAVIDDVVCRAVQMTPAAPVGYTRKVLYLEKDGLALRGIDYMDGKGTLVRQYRLLRAGTSAGASYPALSVMRSLGSGTETTLEVKEIDAVRVIPEKNFNKGNL